MQSWYEFGYHGYPTGERRKRFCRQRDDPCDSDDEQRAAQWYGADDETNDRPEYHYRLRESEEEEASSSSSSSSLSSWQAADDDEKDDDNGVSNDDVRDSRPWQQRRRRRQRRPRRHGRCDGAKATRATAASAAAVPALVQCTLHEHLPAWYGCSAVTFAVVVPDNNNNDSCCNDAHTPHTRRFALYHGGASCATHCVTHRSHLIEVVASSSSSGDECVPAVPCARLRDVLLLQRQQQQQQQHEGAATALHTTLRHRVCEAPPRFGHCAVSLDVSTHDALAALQLHTRPGCVHSSSRRSSCGSACCGDNNNDDDADNNVSAVHLSLLVGGVSCATPLRASAVSLSSSSSSQPTLSPLLPQLQLTTRAAPRGVACPLALCITLLQLTHHARNSSSSAVMATTTTTTAPASYYTAYCPLAVHTTTAATAAASLSSSAVLHATNDGDNNNNDNDNSNNSSSSESAVTSAQLPCCVFATLTRWPALPPCSSLTSAARMCGDGGGCGSNDNVCRNNNSNSSSDGSSDVSRKSSDVCCFALIGGVAGDLTFASDDALLDVRLLTLQLRTWQVAECVLPTYGAVPCARYGHSTTDYDGCLFVYGGVCADARHGNDLHVLDARTCVWRQVYTPLHAAPPCRALHVAAVVCAHSRSRSEDADEDRVARHVARYAKSDGGVDCSGRADEALQLSYLQRQHRHHRCCVWLAVAGGEGATGAEPSVWLYALCEHGNTSTAMTTRGRAQWRRCTFPLLHMPACYHVAAPLHVDKSDSNSSGSNSSSSRGVTANAAAAAAVRSSTRVAQGQLCRVVRTRVQQPSASTTATDARVRHAYVAACHGALPQLLSWCATAAPPSSSLLLLGGVCSVSVLLTSQLTPSDCSVRQRAAFWSLSAHVTAMTVPRSVTTTATTTTAARLLAMVLQHGSDSDSSGNSLFAAVARDVYEAAVAATSTSSSSARRNGDGDGDATAFASLLHEQQLLHWTRAATQLLQHMGV